MLSKRYKGPLPDLLHLNPSLCAVRSVWPYKAMPYGNPLCLRVLLALRLHDFATGPKFQGDAVRADLRWQRSSMFCGQEFVTTP